MLINLAALREQSSPRALQLRDAADAQCCIYRDLQAGKNFVYFGYLVFEAYFRQLRNPPSYSAGIFYFLFEAQLDV